MIDDEFDEDDLEAMGDAWLAANDPADPDELADRDGLDDPGEPAGPDESADAGPLADPAADPLAAFGFVAEGDGDDLAGLDAEPEPSEGGAQLAWRETYYVLFSKADRPTLTQVEGAITDTGRGMQVENLQADDDGLFQSVLIQSPEDNAALEISFEAGDAVVEQSVELAKLLQDTVDGDQLAK
ncbi:MAG: hypothetical protein AAF596_08175, partial [Planctomycetota bacterium]